jgi:sugar lactone lactonase YvrE
MTAEIYDNRPCALGEGPLWHPERQQLFWFDIVNARLLSRVGDIEQMWEFNRMVSAAGWVDRDRLLIASETDLFLFDLITGLQTHVVDLEADNPITRSNDGRADPYGGFWIGTMGLNAEPGAGAIYRFYRGELRKIISDVTITNAICFSADGRHGYFTDTVTQKIMCQPLDDLGWPAGNAQVFLDLSPEGTFPDGAVVDQAGNLWVAQWGASRVACYSRAGSFVRSVAVGGRHSSCPAFGGPDQRDLFVTTAREGLCDAVLSCEPQNGNVFVVRGVADGQREHKVVI